jgi:hypothetical protein
MLKHKTKRHCEIYHVKVTRSRDFVSRVEAGIEKYFVTLKENENCKVFWLAPHYLRECFKNIKYFFKHFK